MSKYNHSPASKQALKDGCTCPITDNHNGEGSGYFEADGSPIFWFDYNCRLHGELSNIEPDTILAKCIEPSADT